MKIVAVTSCPTGIAHTYMAAEALEIAAEEAGHEIHVETQGSAGADPLKPYLIAEADAVIFAHDVEIRNRDRFANKPTVDKGVKAAISDGPGLIKLAEQAAATFVPAAPGTPGATVLVTKVDDEAGLGTRIRQWLMTGVSYMIPFVAAGGILIALGFLFGGDDVVTKLYGGTLKNGHKYTDVAGSLPVGFSNGGTIDTVIHQAGYAGVLFVLGKIAFFMLVPILAGFIAFAIADRPGLVPGVVGGLIAGVIGAGFLGGIVIGGLAGFVALYLTRIKVPKGVRGIMPVVVIPLVSTFVVGIVMFLVIGKPITSLTKGLTHQLNSLSGSNAIFLGVILGLMMAFDMGGPINKTAYAFAAAGLSTGTHSSLTIMAAVMAAGMTPPLALALATTVRPKLFTEPEIENGRAAWLLGLSFITEGAIPFAAADPLRVIPSLMAGSAVTGALSMAFGNTLRAPHGGIFVVELVGRPFLYLLAIVVGTLVSAVVVVFLKGMKKGPSDADIDAHAPAATAAMA